MLLSQDLRFKRLADHAESLGVAVVVLPPGLWQAYRNRYPDFGDAPFIDGLAISYKNKKLLVQDAVQVPHVVDDLLGGAIHELGHIVACRKEPDDSSDSDFLGWEYLTAVRLRLTREWHRSMRHYGTRNGDSFGYVPYETKLHELEQAIKEGRQYGNVEGRTPKPVR